MRRSRSNDGIRSDNCLVNLRVADRGANARNRRLDTAKNLLMGVSKAAQGKFSSSITVDGSRYFLGIYQTEQLAHSAYVDVKKRIEEAEKRARQTLMEQVIQERNAA